MANTNPKSSDDIRHEILEIFESFKPQVAGYSEYAAKVAALGLAYLEARIREEFPNCEIREATQVYSEHLHSTPQTVDRAIGAIKIANTSPKLVIIDRANQKVTMML